MKDKSVITLADMLMNIGNVYILSGDQMRCVECRRAQHVEYAREKFQHASWCEKSDNRIDMPWMGLKNLMMSA
jgi:hypothetical protein